jgi:hypothetical protein
MPPTYEVFQESDSPERWAAEAIDFAAGGLVYTVLFLGPDSENRAREYAEWKNHSDWSDAASA